MVPFTHECADKAWIEFKKDKSGGFAPVSITIIANIPLARASTGYQPSRVTELKSAADAYAKKLGVPVIFKSDS